MKLTQNLTVLCCLCMLHTVAQPDIIWQKKYGGSAEDGARSMALTVDGGCIMAGLSASADIDLTGNQGGMDYWVVKVNASGDMEWQKNFGGLFNDMCFTVITTADGGYALAGSASSNDGDIDDNHSPGLGDYWIIKLNSSGEIEWERCYGGTSFDNGYAIIQSSDGGYVFCGDGGSSDGDISGVIAAPDFWLVKVEPNGDIEWQKALGGASGDFAYALVEADDGGFVVTGKSSSWDSGVVTGNHGGYDIWVLKTDSTGELLWQKSLGGTGWDEAQEIIKLSGGEYVLAGNTGSSDGDVTGFLGVYDFWVVKINDSGELIWQKALGGYNDDKGFSLAPTQDNGFVVTGFAMSDDGNLNDNHGGHDAWVTKLSDTGEMQWQKNYGGAGEDDGKAIAQMSNGDYLVLASSTSNDGDANSSNGSSDFWLLRLAGSNQVNELNFTSSSLVFSPNPCVNHTTGKIISPDKSFTGGDFTLMDALGKVVFSSRIIGLSIDFDASFLTDGLYSYCLKSPDQHVVLNGKLVVVK